MLSERYYIDRSTSCSNFDTTNTSDITRLQASHLAPNVHKDNAYLLPSLPIMNAVWLTIQTRTG